MFPIQLSTLVSSDHIPPPATSTHIHNINPQKCHQTERTKPAKASTEPFYPTWLTCNQARVSSRIIRLGGRCQYILRVPCPKSLTSKKKQVIPGSKKSDKQEKGHPWLGLRVVRGVQKYPWIRLMVFNRNLSNKKNFMHAYKCAKWLACCQWGVLINPCLISFNIPLPFLQWLIIFKIWSLFYHQLPLQWSLLENTETRTWQIVTR